MQLELDRTVDILGALRGRAGRRVVVGFAAETDDVLANASRKLREKGLALIVANDVTAPDAGFAVDTNAVTLIDASGRTEVPLASKDEVADRILDRVVELAAARRGKTGKVSIQGKRQKAKGKRQKCAPFDDGWGGALLPFAFVFAFCLRSSVASVVAPAAPTHLRGSRLDVSQAAAMPDADPHDEIRALFESLRAQVEWQRDCGMSWLPRGVAGAAPQPPQAARAAATEPAVSAPRAPAPAPPPRVDRRSRPGGDRFAGSAARAHRRLHALQARRRSHQPRVRRRQSRTPT